MTEKEKQSAESTNKTAKQDKTAVKDSQKKELYDINPAILSLPMGYSAVIEGINIMVVPNHYGEGFNRNNEKIRVLKEPGYVMINGNRTQSNKFEDISDYQLYQLVCAGVILLSEKQKAEFRKKFFKAELI